ncbi:MAG: hypothetical protein WB507_09490 [Solirubrobacterales bacterium]
MPRFTHRSLGNRTAPQGPDPRVIAPFLVGILVFLLGVGASSASASDPIEGIWSYNGGKVGIQSQGSGKFTGTVVEQTKVKFAQCYHLPGEQMWTSITPQPDGSYWGFHQWFFETSECVPNPTLGLTAWRVLKESNGTPQLKVCFSEPGSSSQPMIASSGAASGDTYGCRELAQVSSLPEISSFGHYVELPSTGACVKRRKLRIRLHDPKNDPLKTVAVRLDGGTVHRLAKLKRHGSTVTATLSLQGIAVSSFTVTVKATTVLGDHLSGKRTYHSCSGKLLGPHVHPTHG